ncbi:fatty oxidation complex, alpha subunit [Myxococcus xanthus DK 1622]|uniref:Fatty oxidation complex, alpha subunit n=1 Tax=Myxococcus xanthus (strain DK1622) TaxID=246197 RepID=Q1CWX2_MYXXD|nr:MULTISPECIES: 3-hydroxyacyl-CoA dehydrogenase NAD-binding domain-containing protein [Myxococcus]ABF90251.1 fatty oxidation complex, alpha subunit [Myxococcus xanthus DK 1622]NOJ56204.1 3-hydroxyacyl-CoA dehydrogenase [Myxococcus xanthus]QPM79267.1 enoyl-CoA hydratase/isomerase family protein [Myxococcus xanthus]QVW68345.1 enoyl-CoA hydratase/isomerase family protein [Myxococcus xanthus DZ2]QZZ54590.1 Fatty acid oxidation complex subunit alpha [Myxococcus xanthus]
MSEQNTIRWDKDADGIVVLTLDDPNQSANTMNAAYLKSMRATVDRLVKEKDTVAGVILTSAKKTFFAGGDLKDLLKVRKEDAKQAFELGQEIKAQLRTLETLGKPVVAAINGAALGGGLEIALACHHRIIADVKGAQVGLPEVTLGLLPGGGGVVRTVRMLGIVDALMKVLLQGQRYRPQEAKEAGLVHEVVDSVEALLPAAKAWVKAHPTAQQPWDQKGYKIPGGTPSSPGLAANLPAFPANLRKQLKGANMPAPRAIMATAVESTQVDVDTAFTVESRYFTELVTGQVAKNMIQAFFFDMQHINSGGGRPKGYPQHTAKKVGVLGAGMMGAGIAYVCAKAGIDVVLKDVSLASAEKGKQYSVKLVEKAIQKGKSTKEKGDALLARIHPTTDAADLKGCDLVIEAVFEDVKLKHQVFQEVQDVVAPDAVLGSNTSTLPISVLAEGVKRTEDFVGMHFFSPVDKMPLLELIAGKKTSDATLAKAIDIAVQIGKTPIVVNDSRGFFTSRVIGTFLNEAIAMVGEGISPASVEQAGLQAGYPAAPLQLVDELTLTLPRKIRQETKAAILAEGKPWVEHRSYAVMDAMIDQHQRKGRSTGGGFYDYVDGKRTGLWAGLAQHFTKPGHTIPFEDMKERMLFAEAVDTVRCFDEGVLRSAADANIGSILGIGFPAWTGGVAQFINGYEGRTGNGPRGFIARARELAQRYGAHFEPPASLVEMAERGEFLK